MNGHDWEMLILRTSPVETSEAVRESGPFGVSGVWIRVRLGAELFFVSRHPQVFDGSSTGFPH
jgi:hypothetical protein